MIGLARVLAGRATLVPVLYSIGGVLRLFLASAQAVALQRDLDLTRSRLGIAVGACFAASAVAATPLGHVVGRLGPSAGLRMPAALSLVALLGVAAVAQRWWHVAVALAVSGVANASAQVASDLALAGGVPAERQGFAFGAKQAAIPVASLLAGLSLPAIAVLAGWPASALVLMPATGAALAAVRSERRGRLDAPG